MLVWEDYLLSCCRGLFCECYEIIEMNLTHFNTVKVTDSLLCFKIVKN